MQGVLGAAPHGAPPPERVTVSILQSLRYLQLPPEYKKQLAGYRAAALGADLEPLLAKTHAALASAQPEAKQP